MALRCLLFSSDEQTAQPIRQVLAELGIEGEHCAVAVEAVERVTSQTFQLVIVDWNDQPEAGFLLNTARERKAAERPLTLAIVGNDASVPQALQAGANSILRKPIQVHQVKDTLTTARDLLNAKLKAAAPMAKAAADAASAAATAAARSPENTPQHSIEDQGTNLRAGEFLQPSTSPGAQFDPESSVQKEIQQSLDDAAASEADPLSELEPMAAPVHAAAPAPEAPRSDEPRGLAWYLNNRAGASASAAPVAATAPAPPSSQPELLGYDQNPLASQSAPPARQHSSPAPAASQATSPAQHAEQEKKADELFAYISGEAPEKVEKPSSPAPAWLGKAALAGIAAMIAIVALVLVPGPTWKKNVQLLAGYAHSWLNPQPVTTAQAPRSHENFGRAGDEYKLPVAENIPDATTDPSQIRVVPVVDPTAKQPNGAVAGTQTPAGTDPATTTPDGQTQATSGQPQVNPAVQPGATANDPNSSPSGTTTAPAPTVVVEQRHLELPSNEAPVASQPAPEPPKPAQPRYTPTVATPGIPTSLKSQMTTSTPEASGNKPVDAAMPAIEPVEVPEATIRGFLLEQPAPAYPEGAKGQQGTVILAVLIGRDGTVQDAKFLQGSLAFARAAIDGVKQWKFQPYLLNNRPVSTQTRLTLSFKPAS